MNEVQAIRNKSQLEQIETLLSECGPIYLDVWKFGLNTTLRISDILAISMDSVTSLDEVQPNLIVKEKKTGKTRNIVLNEGALAVVAKRVAQNPTDVWLFQSTSGRISRKNPTSINRQSVARVFSTVGDQLVPRAQLSTHSMRKTRGYFLHASGLPITTIAKILNQSSTSITMRYIGLTQQDIDDSFTELVL